MTALPRLVLTAPTPLRSWKWRTTDGFPTPRPLAGSIRWERLPELCVPRAIDLAHAARTECGQISSAPRRAQPASDMPRGFGPGGSDRKTQLPRGLFLRRVEGDEPIEGLEPVKPEGRAQVG